MVSIWYVYAVALLGVIGIMAALWRGASIFAKMIAEKRFWIVTHHHRYGDSAFPVFGRKRRRCFRPRGRRGA